MIGVELDSAVSTRPGVDVPGIGQTVRGSNWAVVDVRQQRCLGVATTLKDGSKSGITSPPGVWRPRAHAGQAITRPGIHAGERLQGSRAGRTDLGARDGVRWKMVGNAVSVPVPVPAWIGRRIVEPRPLVNLARRPLDVGRRWPSAATSVGGVREEWTLSERPLAALPRQTLATVLGEYEAEPLSLNATSGFASRSVASNLRRRPDFVEELRTHIEYMSTV